jgi:hypothetical protein
MNLSKLTHLSERTRDYLMVIPGGVIYFAIWPLIGQAKAFAVAMVFGVFYVIVSRSWDKRSDGRFWLILGLFAAIHIVALWLINFPHLRVGLAVLPFALVDGFAMLGILSWAVPRKPTGQP